uniref:Uncharacterized protein n=1 Tax=Triticum urartu TaxID=4572 RepID=A0A8R7U707_TRIUA
MDLYCKHLMHGLAILFWLGFKLAIWRYEYLYKPPRTSNSHVSGLMSIKCHEKFKNCMGRVKATSRLGSPRNANMNSLFATHMLSQLGSQLGGAGIPHIGVKTIMSMHVAAR